MLKAQPSHRYLVLRDPDQFSNPASPASPSFGPPPWTKDEQPQEKVEDSASTFAGAISTRPSSSHRSVANSAMPRDGRQLQRLPVSANRLSSMSSGQRTLITSQCSSTGTSPTCESTSTFSVDEFSPNVSAEDIRPRPNATAINDRRGSIQVLLLEAQYTPNNFRHSTLGVPNRPRPSHSLLIPNFSAPIRPTSATVLVAEAREIPMIVTTIPTPNRPPRRACIRGAGNPPPAALHAVRSLSLVADSSSPQNLPHVLPLPERPLKRLQQSKPQAVDIPPRFPHSSTLVSPEIFLVAFPV